MVCEDHWSDSVPDFIFVGSDEYSYKLWHNDIEGTRSRRRHLTLPVFLEVTIVVSDDHRLNEDQSQKLM